jgi:hypothetical protein
MDYITPHMFQRENDWIPILPIALLLCRIREVQVMEVNRILTKATFLTIIEEVPQKKI